MLVVRISAVTVAVETLHVLRMQIFGVNVVLYRWLFLSMHILSSIIAVYTLLMIRMQIIGGEGGR